MMVHETEWPATVTGRMSDGQCRLDGTRGGKQRQAGSVDGEFFRRQTAVQGTVGILDSIRGSDGSSRRKESVWQGEVQCCNRVMLRAAG